MRVQWLAQIRRFNLVLLAIVTLCMFLSYLHKDVVENPKEYFQVKRFAPLPFISTEIPKYTSATNRSTGVLTEMFYEEGHAPFNPELCPDLGTNTKLVIAVISAPDHENARLAVRETWGDYATWKGVTVAFIIGVTPNQTTVNSIEKEQEMYGDILRGKFLDTYDNLTLKTISALEWVDNYCPKAYFILKTDDDTFINIFYLLAFIRNGSTEQRAIYGRVAKNWKPVRNKSSKYYISKQQYKYKKFPIFTTGPAYLLPTRLSREIYLAALKHSFFKLEDVFLTGTVARQLKIRRVHVPAFFNNRILFKPCNLRKIISIHKIKSEEQYILWQRLQEAKVNCTKVKSL